MISDCEAASDSYWWTARTWSPEMEVGKSTEVGVTLGPSYSHAGEEVAVVGATSISIDCD